MLLDELYEAIRAIPEAQALALAGSRASGNDDEYSDYDLYVYGDVIVDPAVREKVIRPLCSYAEIGNCYYESEDNVILSDGTPVDIIYRCFDRFEAAVDRVAVRHLPLSGYSTCFLHNIKTCGIIFDKTGRLTSLKERACKEYPPELKQAIIDRNMTLLSGSIPSFDRQIKKAWARRDLVSVNHRVTCFLQCYFDVIFAVNELTHPGEKRLVEICKRDCRILPANFEENLQRLFENMFTSDVSDIIGEMIAQLKKVV